jgi:tetratricopeptide (TPR) repeat protein
MGSRAVDGWVSRRVAACAVALSLAFVTILRSAEAGQGPPVDDWHPASLEAWLGVIEDHTPGIIDSALLTAAGWSLDDLRATWIGVNVALVAATTTKRSGFDVAPLDIAARPRRDALFRIRLSRGERRDLDRLATRLRSMGLVTALKRAVVVHTDLVTLVPGLLRASSSSPVAIGAPVRLNAADGSGAGVEGLSVHWDLARLLLRLWPRSQGSDRFACVWFRATIALGQRSEFFDARHVREALLRCPDDPVLLFLAGAEREAMASSFFQAFARATAGSTLRPEIDDSGSEFEAAERFYRRALARDPALAEARVRLGRVLIERGRMSDAEAELRAALSTRLDPVVEYLAALFLGTALEATAQLAEAQDTYRRAATLSPGARLPHLALARVAFALGDTDGLAGGLDAALRQVEDGAPIDPWLGYRSVPARHADDWLDQVRRAARDGST